MRSAENPVVIELDAAPASLNHLTSGDYSERCVVSALHSPVLELSSATGTCDNFGFKVVRGQRFSDGSVVEAEDVLRTLVAAAASPMWSRYIRYVLKIEAVDDRLFVTTRQPAGFLPSMLEAVDFSPTHPDGHLGNGPYRLSDDFTSESGYYLLTPNPHFPNAAERPELAFAVRPDVEGAPERFRRGEADITCSTAFPLKQLGEWHGDNALRSAPTGIYMQLEPNPAGPGMIEPRVWKTLRDCLDLHGIAGSFSDGLHPVSSDRQPSELPGGPLPSCIRISYHDFYPNRLVLQEIICQWRDRMGIKTELVERDYADFSRGDVDACFALRYSAFKHPFAFYAQCAALTQDLVLDRLLQRFAACEPGSFEVIRNHVDKTVPVLRLFEVIGHWLAGPRTTGFSWPTDAVFDFTSLRRNDWRCA
jgi:peptide/nickel transport system substrate-binding protein